MSNRKLIGHCLENHMSFAYANLDRGIAILDNKNVGHHMKRYLQGLPYNPLMSDGKFPIYFEVEEGNPQIVIGLGRVNEKN